ncbi:hypothetical protein KJ590_01785 [Patescibacteria group bacterium]|nr:hypothetical protein [Patescibacteria group bacterium]
MVKDMLGALIRKIVDLPLEMLNVIYDLSEKLSGEAGQEWLTELKKFLRKENCWTGVVAETILRLISGGKSLVLDSVDGTETLADAKDMFAYIDSDFKNYGADEPGQPTAETPVGVHEMIKDAAFSQMFGSLSSDVRKLCLTQHQIKNFVKKHRKWLRTEGYATFFLFESKGQFFVAGVRFHAVGSLHVLVYRFGLAHVWRAEHRHRVVVPKLA